MKTRTRLKAGLDATVTTVDTATATADASLTTSLGSGARHDIAMGSIRNMK